MYACVFGMDPSFVSRLCAIRYDNIFIIVMYRVMNYSLLTPNLLAFYAKLIFHTFKLIWLKQILSQFQTEMKLSALQICVTLNI